MTHEIKIVAAVLAHIRGEITASCVADSLGVTELQVQAWKDIFQVAGVVALTNALKTGTACCGTDEDDDGEEPTTTTRRPRRKPSSHQTA
jgi:hypothetical protein